MILITGSITAKPETFDALRNGALEHTRRSRAEPGCLAHKRIANINALRRRSPRPCPVPVT